MIYIAANIKNGKCYIGQTKIKFERRLRNHLSVATTKGSTTPFHRAIRKYGIQGFSFGVLEKCAVALLDERERHWIAHLNTKTPNGYNRTDGGQGAAGCEYTEERRERIRQSQLGDLNRMKDPETARKHGDTIRGVNHPYYGKSGPLHPRFGKHHKLSEQTKARQRAAFNKPEVIEARRTRALARERNSNGSFIRKVKIEIPIGT